MPFDRQKVLGIVSIYLNGKLQYTSHNMIVNSGFTYFSNRLMSNDNLLISHIALGTGTSAPSAYDTELEQETVRIGLFSSQIATTNIASDSVEFISNFDINTGSFEVSEAGLFNASSTGEMIARIQFPTISKSLYDTMSINWKIVFV